MSSKAYCASEKRIKKTIEALSEDVYPSVQECTKEIKLNQKILNNRWNEKTFKITRESINKRLTTAQKRAIKNYIMRMNKKNMLLTFKFVENVVNFVLRKTDSNAIFLKNHWIKRFLDRNLDFKKQRQRFISIHKKDIDWISTLKQYFHQLKNVINQYNIQILDTWNMNETDFRIECKKNYIIVILITKKSLSRIINSNNRKYIIFIKIINIVDDIISFFFIFKKSFIVYRLIINEFH